MARENLIPFNKLSEAEHKEIASRGGKASVKARRAKKTMQEMLTVLMSAKIKDPKLIQKLADKGVKPKDMNNQSAVLVGQMLKAINGDTKAAEFIRDTLGENPNKVQVEFNTNGTTEAIILKLEERKNGFDEEREDATNSN